MLSPTTKTKNLQALSIIAIVLAATNIILSVLSILDSLPRMGYSEDVQSNYYESILNANRKSGTSSLCERIVQSSFTSKSIAIVRILGPSLPPLQSPYQMELNLRHILTNEIEVRSSEDCIKSFWVIQCMTDIESEQRLVQILEEFDQEYYKSTECSNNSTERLDQILNVNTARNYATLIATKLYNPEWILPLDGNVFLPREAIQLVVRSLIFDSARGNKIHLIPFFRILSCQKEFFNNEFMFEYEFKKYSHFKDFNIHPAISDVISRRQEGQFALSSWLHNVNNFFSEEKLYSKAPKLSIIDSLAEDYDGQFSCGTDVGKENRSRYELRQPTMDYVKRCGYVLRLLYWPEKGACPYMEKITVEKISIDPREFGERLSTLSRTPEVSSFTRKKMRERSVNKVTNFMINVKKLIT